MPEKIIKKSSQNKNSFEVNVTQADYTMTAMLERQSLDLLIQIIGGDIAHYGVVMTIDKTGHEETIALPSRPGHVHQENVLIDQVAKAIKPLLQGNAFLVSGMHVNDITPEQMHAAIPMAQTLGEELAKWLKKHPGSKPIVSYAKSNK